MKHEAQVVMLPTQDSTHIRTYGNNQGILYLSEELKQGHLLDGVNCRHLYITVDQKIESIEVGDWYLEAIMGSYMIHQMNQKSLDGWTKDINHRDNFRRRCKKIIATTDKSLLIYVDSKSFYIEDRETGLFIRKDGKNYKFLPQISQSSIERYCANPAGKWKVEYKDWCDYDDDDPTGLDRPDWRLVLNSDNTINISPVKEKLHLSIHIHEGIYNTNVDIIDDEIHVKPSPDAVKMYSKAELKLAFEHGKSVGTYLMSTLDSKYAPLTFESWIKENL